MDFAETTHKKRIAELIKPHYSFYLMKKGLLQQLLLQSLNHVDRHLVEVVLRVPAPLCTSAAVVHLVRPDSTS